MNSGEIWPFQCQHNSIKYCKLNSAFFLLTWSIFYAVNCIECWFQNIIMCSINVQKLYCIGRYVLYILKVCAVNRLRMLCVYVCVYTHLLYIFIHNFNNFIMICFKQKIWFYFIITSQNCLFYILKLILYFKVYLDTRLSLILSLC